MARANVAGREKIVATVAIRLEARGRFGSVAVLRALEIFRLRDVDARFESGGEGCFDIQQSTPFGSKE